jgi:hypothetical protein
MSGPPDLPAINLVEDPSTMLDLESAKTVDEFLNPRDSPRPRLSLDDRLTLVDEAIKILDGLYVHLPVKRAMYAVDPVRRLQLLRFRLEQSQRQQASGDDPDPAELDDLWFHREMIDTFTSVRDLHTMYVLPEPFGRAVALVPFQIESYFGENRKRRYIVTNVISDLDWLGGRRPDDFIPGVEVEFWNDVRIERAVELVGEHNSGSNSAARLSRGLARLTIRPLARALPPDEEFATVRYRTLDGQSSTYRIPWGIVVLKQAADVPLDGAVIRGMYEAMDYESDFIREVSKQLYAPYPRKDSKWQPYERSTDKGLDIVEEMEIPAEFHSLIQAKRFSFDGAQYGYLRLRSFSVNTGDKDRPNRFVALISELAGSMPENGLIIDIRDNPGGYVPAAERLLQLFTPLDIAPEPAQFIATPLSVWLCEKLLASFEDWLPSLEDAMRTKAMYSLAFPLTDIGERNDIGQRYYGPVVLITNALCYSAADIFAAGFQDHRIGCVLGIDDSTGAGGAQVFMHSSLLKLLEPTNGNRLSPLPGGADLRFATRRTLRVGDNDGKQLEDLGVKPDILYCMTRDDLLYRNFRLIQEAVKSLGAQKRYRLREIDGSVQQLDGAVCATIEAENFSRLDLGVDGWQSLSIAITPELQPFKISANMPPNGQAKCLELRGYDKDSTLVASRRVTL